MKSKSSIRLGLSLNLMLKQEVQEVDVEARGFLGSGHLGSGQMGSTNIWAVKDIWAVRTFGQ